VVNALAPVFDLGDQRGIQSFRKLVLQAPALAIFFIPLGAVGGDLRLVGRDFPEEELANRKNLQAMIPEDAHVELASLNVFFGDDIVVVLLVDELDAFLELVVILDKGRLRDAEGGLLLERLHQDGKLEARRTRDPLAARDGHKVRHMDAVIAENFFGDAFVFAERQAGRAAAGERQPLHFQEGNDILVEGAVVLELIGEVEDDVRLEVLELLPHEVEIVEDGEVLGGVAELFQRREHMGFGFPIIGLQLRAEILVERGGRNGVEQRQDFEFLFHGYFVRLNRPVNR
jgi:hypothetical protein